MFMSTGTLPFAFLLISVMFWSILGRCSASTSGRKGTDFDQEDQAAAGPRWWKEHAYRRNQRHEGHAGCQGEKSQCPAEKGTSFLLVLTRDWID